MGKGDHGWNQFIIYIYLKKIKLFKFNEELSEEKYLEVYNY